MSKKSKEGSTTDSDRFQLRWRNTHSHIRPILVTLTSLIVVTLILPLLIIIISYFRMPCILTGPGGHHRSSAVNLLHISLPCRRLCHDLWEWRLTPSVTYQHNVCFVWATPSEVFSMHSSHPCGREGESAAAGDKLISTPFCLAPSIPQPSQKKKNPPPPPPQAPASQLSPPGITHTHFYVSLLSPFNLT